MNVQTYLYFNGRCQDAIELYREALGAEVLYLCRFGEAPEPLRLPGHEDRIFHATLRIGDTLLNLSDDMAMSRGPMGGFSLLVHMDAPERVDMVSRRLAVSGHLDLPAQPVPWATQYAIATDPFGVTWKLQFSD